MVAVTGANGFVGKALVAELDARGREVRRLVRTPDGGAGIAVGAISSDTDWSDALEGVDTIIHAAARVHVMNEEARDPLAAFRLVNVAGTRKLGDQAAKAGVGRLIFVSSIKVNGEATVADLSNPAFTAADLPRPEDPYGQSKWEAELTLHEVAARTGLEVVIVRPPLVYGPGVRANFLRLIRLVQRGVPLPLGSVKNRRSLVGLDNLVDLLIRCVDHPAAVGQTFLVSDGHDLSTPELIRRLAEAMGRPARLLPFPPALLRLGGRLTGYLEEVKRLIGSLQADIRHTCEMLDWYPPVPVEEGIRRTMEAYR